MKKTAKWIDVLELIELLEESKRRFRFDFSITTHTHTHTNANTNENYKSGLFLFVRYTQILRSLNKS